MLADNETEMTFDRKADALRVKRRLYDHGILCRYHTEGRGGHWLTMLVPPKMTAQAAWEFARKLYFEK
jgi:hypothetical protein